MSCTSVLKVVAHGYILRKKKDLVGALGEAKTPLDSFEPATAESGYHACKISTSKANQLIFIIVSDCSDCLNDLIRHIRGRQCQQLSGESIS